jgi:anaerobic magnesium-protoporphyrin IX monomethyl ester cyclase
MQWRRTVVGLLVGIRSEGAEAGKSMEPVLLINCPRELSPHQAEPSGKHMPLGILYVGAVLRSNDISCTFLDAEACRLGISEILQRAATLKPALIGLNCHTLNRWTVYEIARSLKIIVPTAQIALGGAHPSLAPVRTLEECPEVDAIVVGEGEITFLEIARSEGNLEAVRGLYLRKAEKIVSTGRRERILELDSLPYPDLVDAPMKDYLEYENPDLPGQWKKAYLAATRGCQYKCSFCTEWSFWGARNTARTAGSILAEINMYQSKYGVKRFYFYDDTFTDWLDFQAFCSQAKDHDIEWSCSTRIEHLDQRTIDILRQGGCREIVVGLESGSAATLQSVNKGWDNHMSQDKVGSAIADCNNAGIRMRAHFMLGFPWETKEDMTRSVRFAIALKDYGLSDANFFTVKVYPGTTFAGKVMRATGTSVDLTEAWSVHDADLTKNTRVAAKLRRFNDISRYPLNPHMDSLSIRALARRSWELFFSDAREEEIENLLWEGIEWKK